MSKEIMVSIICNTYNHEKYIRDALNSFVNQKTNFNFEVLVHDDASTDSTAQVIKEFEEKYPTIIKPIYQKENQRQKGINITYGIQLPRSKGKYIAFCEGDDYWTDIKKLQISIDFLESNKDYVAVTHKTYFYDVPNKKIVSIIGLDKQSNSVYSDYSFQDALKNSCHTSSFVIRKEVLLLKKPKFFNAIKGVGDFPLKIFVAYYGKVVFLNRIMSLYRYMSNPLSYSSILDSCNKNEVLEVMLLDHLKMMKSVLRFSKKEKKRLVKQRILEIYQLIAIKTRAPFYVKSFIYFACYIKIILVAVKKRLTKKEL